MFDATAKPAPAAAAAAATPAPAPHAQPQEGEAADGSTSNASSISGGGGGDHGPAAGGVSKASRILGNFRPFLQDTSSVRRVVGALLQWLDKHSRWENQHLVEVRTLPICYLSFSFTFLDGIPFGWLPSVGTIRSVGSGALSLRGRWRRRAAPRRPRAAAAVPPCVLRCAQSLVALVHDACGGMIYPLVSSLLRHSASEPSLLPRQRARVARLALQQVRFGTVRLGGGSVVRGQCGPGRGAPGGRAVCPGQGVARLALQQVRFCVGG